MSDDSEPVSSPITKKTKKARRKPLLDSSSDSSSDLDSSPLVTRKRPSKNQNHIQTSESDSSIEKPRKKQRVYKVKESETETSDSESSDSEIIVNKKIIAKSTGTKLFSESDSFSENSYSESENYSDSSDGQSEKCPICLLKFKNQEIGCFETCNHIFCFECLQTWSQNVNTCPIDRQTFSLILVRKEVNGKIIRQVTVESKTEAPEAPEPPEDPTFCEICGQSDREDRLLLCDGCDLGYHLECLDPPLEFVPLEEWFCQICLENDQVLHQNYQHTPPRNTQNQSNSPRLIPRTSQTQRVRTQIAARRNQTRNHDNNENNHFDNLNNFDQIIELGSNSSGFESFGAAPGASSTRKTLTRKKSTRKGRKTKRRSRTYYLDIDPNTGEKIKVYRSATKRKTRKRRKKVSRRRQKTVKNVAKTVKKRLAAQLGFCAPQKSQNVSKTPNCSIAIQRYHAGIPALHLFGQRDQLDYFSDEDFENSGGGVSLITSSTRQITDVLAARRAARRKMAISTPPTINSVDILGSILSEQSKLHSKNTTLSLTSDGTLKIESNFDKNEKIDLKKVEVTVVQAPMFPNRNNSNNRPYFRGNSHPNYHGNSSNYDGGSYSYSRGGPRGGNYSSNNQNYNYQIFGNQNYGHPNFGAPPNFRGRGPIRFPMRRLPIENQNENIDFYDGPTTEPAPTQNEPENVDIYSDIEEGGFVDDEVYKSSPPRNLEPAPVPDFEGQNSSENEDLVIDDSEKYDPADPSHDSDDNSQNDETTQKLESPKPESPQPEEIMEVLQPSASQIHLNITRVPTVSKELLKEAVKEVLHEHLDKKKSSTITPEASDDDDCPNFSIYSAESIDIAKKTDSDIPEPHAMENIQPSSPNLVENEPKIYENEENLVQKEDIPVEAEIGDESEEKKKDLMQTNQESEPICDQKSITVEENPVAPEVDQNSEEVNYEENEFAQKEIDEEDQEPVVHTDPSTDLPEKDKNDAQNVKKSLIKVAFDPKRKTKPETQVQKQILSLYDDSDLEEWVPKHQNTDDVTELEKMTEAISEEERSYTPCLDEKEPCKNFSEIGISGLDTEMISDDEKNDFDFQNENSKTNFENFDALEINAKESELDLAKPEDYEEGEIIEKSKSGMAQKEKELSETNEVSPSTEKQQSRTKNENDIEKVQKSEKVSKSSAKNRQEKEDENMPKKSSEKFKKFSKKERNYRDKENRGRSMEKSEKKKSNKKERKQDLERYCVRSLMADKPRKDQFGRDLSDRNRSLSRDKSPSFSPRSRSYSYERNSAKKSRKRRNSRTRKSRSFSRSPRRRSRSPRRSKTPRPSPNRKRKTYRSISRERERDRDRENLKAYRSLSREKNRYKNSDRKKGRKKSRSPSYNKRNRSFNRDWSPSFSSRSPSRTKKVRENREQSFSPSWTPPLENRPQENLTVILKNNDKSMKKREKRKKGTKNDVFRSKKRRNNTPPPSKEVFASGDNILVSVSFNKPSENDDIGISKKRGSVEKKSKKLRDKRPRRSSPKLSSSKSASKKNSKTANNIKPVAIIDLDNSPFKELTPSPKDIIILSDSDPEKSEKNISQKTPVPNQALSETSENLLEKSPNYASGGPKTPPEPQIKFLISKQTNSLRPILNPLHDPTEQIENEGENDISDNNFGNKGPNTPPEPPNSPPSSPDAYDPFEPTKSRSPTPEPEKSSLSNDKQKNDTEMSSQMSNVNENMSNMTDLKEKSGVTPENAESSDNKNESQDSSITQPERIGVVINQQVQQANVFPTVKPMSNLTAAQQSTQIITSTPTLTANSNLPRTNLFNTPTLGNTSRIIVLPTASKNSPAKMSPTKLPIKSTPIKPMQSSKTLISKLPVPNVKPLPQPRKCQNKSQNSQNDVIEVGSDFESPYSPGSSDYEDLFEPPVEISSSQSKTNSSKNKNSSNTKSPAKNSANQSSTNNFDSLFAASPVFRNKSQSNNNNSSKKSSSKKKKVTPQKHNKTHVGVKLDEDNLKILDDLPNSAVEMQVKDKFLKKLNRQERVVEEVKHVLKPHYNKKHITKEQYKDILRRAVPKICHNKTGEINPKKIQNLIEAYVKRARHQKKAANNSGQQQNQQATQNVTKPAKTTFWS